MADELDPVEQQFIADLLPYVGPLTDAVANAQDFADANVEAKAAIDSMRDSAVEAGGALDDLFVHSDEVIAAQHELRDSAVETGEALGHVRDESLEAAAAEKELGSSAQDTALKMDLMGLAGASTYSSLLPLVGLIGALVIAAAAVAPAVLSMGLGFAGFGALAMPAIMQVMQGLQTITADMNAVQAASTAAARQKALTQLAHDWGAMSGPVRETVHDIIAFKNELSSLAQHTGITSAVFSDIDRALGIAKELLPVIVPLAKQGATAISNMLTSLSSGLKSAGFLDFMRTMTAMVVPASAAIGHLAGALLGVLGHALMALAPMSIPFINFVTVLVRALGGPLTGALHVVISLILGLAHAIEPLIPGLAKIATVVISDIGSGFQQFIPLIQQVVTLLGGSLLKILTDLEPVLANFLTPNSPFMSALGMIPMLLRVILPLFTGLASILANPFVARMAVDIISLIVAFKGLMALLSLARTGFLLLDAAMTANPVGAIVVGIAALIAIFVLLWTHCKGFRDFWIALWHDAEAVFGAVWHAIVAYIHWALGNFQAAIAWFASLPADFHNWFFDVYHAIVDAWQAALAYIKSIPGWIMGALASLGHLMWNTGIGIIDGLWNGIKSRVSALIGYVSNIAGDISGAFSKVLGIFSPSLVFHQHGLMLMTGLAAGIMHGYPLVAAAMAAVTGHLAAGRGSLPAAALAAAGGPSAAPGAAGGGGPVFNVTVNVAGSVIAQQDLKSTVQEAMLDAWTRTGATGFVPYGHTLR